MPKMGPKLGFRERQYIVTQHQQEVSWPGRKKTAELCLLLRHLENHIDSLTLVTLGRTGM